MKRAIVLALLGASVIWAGCAQRSRSDGGGGAGGADASATSSSSAGEAPTSCSAADDTIGCCVGETLYYCSSTSTMKSKACTSGTACGWDYANAYYGCVEAPGGVDPSGTHPIACGD